MHDSSELQLPDGEQRRLDLRHQRREIGVRPCGRVALLVAGLKQLVRDRQCFGRDTTGLQLLVEHGFGDGSGGQTEPFAKPFLQQPEG